MPKASSVALIQMCIRDRLGVNETALSWDENGTTEMSPLTVDVTERKKVVRVEEMCIRDRCSAKGA